MTKSNRRGLPPAPFSPPYRGHRVRVANYLDQVRVGGTMYLQTDDLDKADVLVPLTGCPELTFGRRYRLDSSSQPAGLPPFKEGRQYDILCGKMHDLGGVPDGWEPFLREQVLSLLIEGHSILAFCFAGQGRTGTFLASLVAILEPDVPDPIEAIRHRYSGHAVETRAQAQAIFAIKGMGLPKRWQHLL